MAVRKSAFACLVLFFLSCSMLFSDSIPPLEGPPFRWKVATLAPRGMGYAKQFEQVLMPVIRKESNGELEFKIFWGGVMGDDIEILSKLKKGKLHAAGLSGQGTFRISPEMSILGLPFLFNGYDEVDHIKEKMTDRFDRIAKSKNLNLLLWLDQDFDQIYSADKPMVTKDSFKGSIFATWYGPLEGSMLERLGARTLLTSVPEIPEAVRTGKADAVIAPSIWISGTQLYSTFRFINPMKIRYVPAFVVATDAAVKPMNEQYYHRLLDLRVDLSKKFCDETRLDSQRFVEAMKEYGLSCQSPSEESLDEIRRATKPVWQDLVGEHYPQELLDEIMGRLEKFRGSKKRI